MKLILSLLLIGPFLSSSLFPFISTSLQIQFLKCLKVKTGFPENDVFPSLPLPLSQNVLYLLLKLKIQEMKSHKRILASKLDDFIEKFLFQTIHVVCFLKRGMKWRERDRWIVRESKSDNYSCHFVIKFSVQRLSVIQSRFNYISKKFKKIGKFFILQSKQYIFLSFIIAL